MQNLYYSVMNVPAILLPPFLPNLYDLAIMLHGNPVLRVDHHRFSRKSRVHRGKIRTPEGETQWINLPVHPDDRRKPIKDVRLDSTENWPSEWMKQLTYCYSSSTWFDFFEAELAADFKTAGEMEYLTEATHFLFEKIRGYLEIPAIHLTPAKEHPYWDENPEQVASGSGAGKIYQEHRSRHYLRQAECRIDPPVSFPEYHQTGTGFVPWCCWLDLLFEYGPEAFKVVDELSEV